MGLHASAIHVFQSVGAAGCHGAAAPAAGVHVETRVHARAGTAHAGGGDCAVAVEGVQWGRNGGDSKVGAPSSSAAGKAARLGGGSGSGCYAMIPLLIFCKRCAFAFFYDDDLLQLALRILFLVSEMN